MGRDKRKEGGGKRMEEQESTPDYPAKKKRMRIGEDETINVSLDLEAFDCPICFEPLSPPIYQEFGGNSMAIQHLDCNVLQLKYLTKSAVLPFFRRIVSPLSKFTLISTTSLIKRQ